MRWRLGSRVLDGEGVRRVVVDLKTIGQSVDRVST